MATFQVTTDSKTTDTRLTATSMQVDGPWLVFLDHNTSLVAIFSAHGIVGAQMVVD